MSQVQVLSPRPIEEVVIMDINEELLTCMLELTEYLQRKAEESSNDEDYNKLEGIAFKLRTLKSCYS